MESLPRGAHPLDKTIDKFTKAAEEFLAWIQKEAVKHLWAQYQARAKGIAARLFGRKQGGWLDDEAAWEEIEKQGYALVFPYMTEGAYKGWVKAEQDLLRFGALVDFDEVNPAIMEAVNNASLEAVRLEGAESWVASTREQLRQAMTRFYAAPEVDENDFVAALEPIFGRKRAEGIAITEMTRVYSDASLETARHATAEAMYKVSTVRDERVCEECQAAGKGGPYELDDEEHAPPLHNRCRCDPVIVGKTK